jgi:hypothetical protein
MKCLRLLASALFVRLAIQADWPGVGETEMLLRKMQIYNGGFEMGVRIIFGTLQDEKESDLRIKEEKDVQSVSKLKSNGMQVSCPRQKR